MKSCSTCRWERKDLECFIHHCAHPSLGKFDPVNGPMIPPIKYAIDKCGLALWEKPRTFTEWLLRKRKAPEVGP